MKVSVVGGAPDRRARDSWAMLEQRHRSVDLAKHLLHGGDEPEERRDLRGFELTETQDVPLR